MARRSPLPACGSNCRMTEVPRNPEANQLVNKPRSSDAGIIRPPNGQTKFSKLAARSRGTTKIEAQHATKPRSSDHATACGSNCRMPCGSNVRMADFMRNAAAVQPVNRPRSSNAGILRPLNSPVEFNKRAIRSRGATEVKAQHSAESSAAGDATVLVTDWMGRSDELVPYPLMATLRIVMSAVIREGAVKRSGAEKYHAPEALILHRLHEPLRDGVTIRSLGWAAHDFDTGVLQDLSEPICEVGVTVQDEKPSVPKEATFGVGEDVRDVGHEHPVRVHGGGDDLDGPGRMVDHEEGMMRHQPAERPDLGREEVRGEDGRRMRLQEGPPRGSLAAVWGGIDPVPTEDVAHGVRRHGVTEVGKRALDPVVAPCRVFLGHPDDVAGDRLHLLRIAVAAGRERPFLRDEISMPSKDGVGTDQGGDAGEERASQGMTTHGEAAALLVREPESTLAEHLPEDSVLLPQVFQSVLLVSVQPTGEGQDKELGGEGERFHGGGSLPQRRRKCWWGGAFEHLHLKSMI